MTTKELRKEIKEKLGYNSRQVSVKIHSYSMGSSIYVTIRDSSVNIKAVEDFVKSFESISRCEYSGEILSGGNQYIEVTLSEEVKNELSEKYFEDVMIAMALTRAGVNTPKITDSFSLMNSNHHNSFELLNMSRNGFGFSLGSYYDCEDSARAIALRIYKAEQQAA